MPTDFEQLICDYDFGNFSIQNVQFGYEDDYFERLTELNNSHNYWYDDVQKANVLIIANSDPFTILLAENGIVYGISTIISFEGKLKIANSFTLFLQGLGTAFKAKRQNQQKEFSVFAENEFGTDAGKFWKYCV